MTAQEVGEYRGQQALSRVQAVFSDERAIARLQETAMQGVDAKRIFSVALNVIRTSKALQECEPLSIVGALCQAASVNLIPGDGTGRAWLIPRGGQCQYQIGAQGWRDLAMRSPKVSTIVARCVYPGDVFTVKYGIVEDIQHVPGDAYQIDQNAITHAYAIAHMTDGPPVSEVMVRHEIDRIRNLSQMKNGEAWRLHFAEMARKTVIIRICKSLPRDPLIGRALEIEEQDYIDTTASESTPAEGGETRPTGAIHVLEDSPNLQTDASVTDTPPPQSPPASYHQPPHDLTQEDPGFVEPQGDRLFEDTDPDDIFGEMGGLG